MARPYPRLQRWAITVAPVPSRIAAVESREPSLTTTRSESGRFWRTRSTTLRMVAASLYAGMATSVRWRGAVDILMEAPASADARSRAQSGRAGHHDSAGAD